VAKPRGDLGALVVPKAKSAEAVPHAPTRAPQESPPPAVMRSEPTPAKSPVSPPPAPPVRDSGAAKALTVKLDGATYRRLRRYCQEQEEETGRRVTHQDVMAAALVPLHRGFDPLVVLGKKLR
jgi:hypothetical protein